MINDKLIEVEVLINSTLENVWLAWTQPQFISEWNFASEDWCCPNATNNLYDGGSFSWRMEAKDGSFGFDFSGKYNSIEQFNRIEETLDDGRKVMIQFINIENGCKVVETFEPESQNSIELQQMGWQAILDNFKKFVESYFPKNSLKFEAIINAPISTVYEKMLAEDSYREWTKVFNEHSHFIGSWNKGDKILFIGLDKDGNKGGMVSRIKENIKDKFVSIEHLGMIQGEEEITSGPEVEKWVGGKENYSFFDLGNSTKLVVELDSVEEFANYFNEQYPMSLNILKEICERG